jgi:N-dimethylarginine dimethylaminohydrolase
MFGTYRSGMSIRFLVSPPAMYARPNHLNPWRAESLSYNAANAHRQWDRFIETLCCAGDVALVDVDADESAPDLVFTGTAALINGNLAVLSSSRHPARRRQRDTFREALAGVGLAATSLRQTYLEGAADTLFDRVRPLCYAAYHWSMERGAVLELQELVGCRVLPLQLVDDRFSHLDAALCPLGSGHVLAHLPAFSSHSQMLLRRAIESEYLIEVGVEDALALACSAVEVGESLVLHASTRVLRDRINGAGYRLFSTDLGEFVAAGGSAKDLTLRLDDGPAFSATGIDLGQPSAGPAAVSDYVQCVHDC